MTSTGQLEQPRRRPRQTADWIGSVLAIGGLVLIGATWRLWTPQNLFPRVPAIELITTWPDDVVAPLNWGLLGLCLGALIYLTFGRSARLARSATIIVATAFFALIVLDQHRLQPWVVHIVIGLLLLHFAHPQRRLDYLRWFTVSIYVYSALGKFDAQFLHTVGRDFSGTLLHQLGSNIQWFSDRAALLLAASLPIAELAVGCGLAFRRTRAVAGIAAIVMHLLLLSVLGPWGLRHAWGVLVWNVLFIALDILLFLWPTHASTAETSEADGRRGGWGWIEALLLLALVVPLGERMGLVDHWLGWALYAPHSSRVRVEISAGAVADLPPIVKKFVVEGEPDLLWREVRLDRWSLDTLGAPIYPQQRFQMGVARALARLVAPRDVRVRVLGTANRWSGERTERVLEGRSEIEAAAKNYWFNTTPIFPFTANGSLEH